jgi:hypothetical protein
MTAKQHWLAKRLIIPAGILPPAVNYADLIFNEQARKKAGAAGFEYLLLLSQDPEKINHSPIKGKIPAVHAPFLAFGHSSFGNNRQVIELITNFVYGKNRIPADFPTLFEKTFGFAKKVGARLIVFHTYHLSQNPPACLALLAKMEKEFGIQPVIEHEGPYIDGWMKFARVPWGIKPQEMIAALDKFSPRKKFMICLDTSSLYGYNLPILETAKKVWRRVGQLHLAGSVPGKDLASEISQPEIIDLVNFFYDHNYHGLINAEINGPGNKLEEIIAQIYGASSLLKFPIFKQTAVNFTQKHLINSCQFLLKNI